MTTEKPGQADRPRDDAEQRSLFWEATTNTFRPYAGWVFYGFGALFVLLGYFGISGEAVVAKQLPYLISGGIGGILLAVLGAYLLGIEELRKDSGRLDRMERQIEELHQALLSRPDAPAAADETAVQQNNGHQPTDRVLVVESGTSYHRANCALVSDKEAAALDPDEAVGRGLLACKVCSPLTTAS